MAKAECFCPVETAVLRGGGHPRIATRPRLTLKSVAGFINRLLCDHREGEGGGGFRRCGLMKECN